MFFDCECPPAPRWSSIFEIHSTRTLCDLPGPTVQNSTLHTRSSNKHGEQPISYARDNDTQARVVAFCDLGTHPRGRARHFLAPTRDGMHVQTNQCGSLVRIFRGLTGEWDDCEGGFARHHSYECEFVSSFVYDLWYLGRKPPGTPTGTWFEPQNGKKNHNQSNKGALRLVLVLCCRPPSCAMFAQSDTVFAVLDAPKKKFFHSRMLSQKK